MQKIKQEHSDATFAYVYDINRGVFIKARWQEEVKSGKNKGQMKEKSERLPNPEASSIQEVLNLFNKDSKVEWVKKDFEMPLEKVWKKAKEAFTKQKVLDIIKYTETSLGERGPLKEEKLGERLFG
jgi:hypothetical protein